MLAAQLGNKLYAWLEPRIALKPATAQYTEPVESNQSRHIFTPLVNFTIIIPCTSVFQETSA
jgi:hypothetical protein